jgi:hypothetical protein
MFERLPDSIWKKWSTCTLIAGMKNGRGAMKNSIEVPQKI